MAQRGIVINDYIQSQHSNTAAAVAQIGLFRRTGAVAPQRQQSMLSVLTRRNLVDESRLTDDQSRMLGSKPIVDMMIIRDKLSIDRAMQMSKSEFRNLNSEPIMDIIIRGIRNVDEFLQDDGPNDMNARI